MTESLHVTDGETVALLLRLSAQVEAADELAAAADFVEQLRFPLPMARRRLRLALDAYQAAKT